MDSNQTSRVVSSTKPVQRINDATEALAVADALGKTIAPQSAERDRMRSAPLVEIAAISDTGLLAIAVPTIFGGPGLAHSTIVEVIRRLAVYDPSIAQIFLTHFLVQERMRESDGVVASTVFTEILAGGHIGNAKSERPKLTLKPPASLCQQPDGSLLLNGHKHYTTGALGAKWIAVVANLDQNPRHPVLVFVRPDEPGVVLNLESWRGFGQRSTYSGEIILENVSVDRTCVLDEGPTPSMLPPKLIGAYDLAMHTAIDVGIVRAALDEAARFARDRATQRPEAGVPVVEEQHVQHSFGRFAAKLHALEAMLERGTHAIDVAAGAPNLTSENTADASLAIAESRGLTQELGVQLTSDVLEFLGGSAVNELDGLDRHWRNIRTHSLHDPARTKFIAVGRHQLTGEYPDRQWLI